MLCVGDLVWCCRLLKSTELTRQHSRFLSLLHASRFLTFFPSVECWTDVCSWNDPVEWSKSQRWERFCACTGKIFCRGSKSGIQPIQNSAGKVWIFVGVCRFFWVAFARILYACLRQVQGIALLIALLMFVDPFTHIYLPGPYSNQVASPFH